MSINIINIDMKKQSTLLLIAIFFLGNLFAQTENIPVANMHKLFRASEIQKSNNHKHLKKDHNNKNTLDEWVHWDDGDNYTGIGYPEGGSFSVAAKWTGNQLTAYNGGKIHAIAMYFGDTDFTSLIVKIWTGLNASNLIYQEDFSYVDANSWHIVYPSQDIIIDSNQELWVGYMIVGQAAGNYPAGVDDGPAINGSGNMIKDIGDENWSTLYNLNPELDYNWNIQFYVEEQSTPVTANFSASQTNIVSGQTVSYTNTSTGSTEWDWEFEGGTPSTSTQKNPVIRYNSVGTYNVKLTAKNETAQDIELKNKYITVTSSTVDTLKLDVIANPGTTICELESLTLTANPTGGTGSYQYRWTNSNNSQVMTGSSVVFNNLLLNTEVYLKVTSGTQEVTKTTSITVNEKPPASIMGKGSPNVMLICPHPDLDYQWYNNNQVIPFENKQFYYPGEDISLSGTYYVVTINDNGCASYSDNYTVSTAKYVSNSKNSILGVYPNPSNGTFSIDLNPDLIISNINDYRVEIISVTGQKVWESLFDNDFTVRVNPSVKLLPGIYIVKLYGDKILFDTKKILVQ